MEPLATPPILVDRVYRQSLGAISDRTLSPGRRIRQAALASWLGVSRQPVSHALQLLNHQGLVQISGLQGLEVTPIDPARIRQLYEIRGALDALAARLAAVRARAGLLSAELLQQLRAALRARDAVSLHAALDLLVDADVSFHQTIYQLSGNPSILVTIATQWPHMRRSVRVVLDAESYRLRAWSEHTVIAEMILPGDVEAAGKAAFEHAENAGRLTEQRLLREDLPA